MSDCIFFSDKYIYTEAAQLWLDEYRIKVTRVLNAPRFDSLRPFSRAENKSRQGLNRRGEGFI